MDGERFYRLPVKNVKNLTLINRMNFKHYSYSLASFINIHFLKTFEISVPVVLLRFKIIFLYLQTFEFTSHTRAHTHSENRVHLRKSAFLTTLKSNYERIKGISDMLLIEMGLGEDSNIYILLTERYQKIRHGVGEYDTLNPLPRARLLCVCVCKEQCKFDYVDDEVFNLKYSFFFFNRKSIKRRYYTKVYPLNTLLC